MTMRSRCPNGCAPPSPPLSPTKPPRRCNSASPIGNDPAIRPCFQTLTRQPTSGNRELTRKSPIAAQPIDIGRNRDPAGLDPAVTLVEALGDIDTLRLGVGEDEFGFGEQCRLVGFQGQEIVCSRIADSARDLGIAGDGVDRHQRPLEPAVGRQPLEQQRDRRQFVRLVGHGFLRQNEFARRGEGRHKMQRRLSRAAVVAAARGLAIDRNQVEPIRPAGAHPVRETGRKQRGLIRFIMMVNQRPHGTP